MATAMDVQDKLQNDEKKARANLLKAKTPEEKAKCERRIETIRKARKMLLRMTLQRIERR